jgi:carboxypeptidase T
MKKIFLILTFLFVISSMNAQQKFSRVNIDLQNITLEKLIEYGLEIDHGIHIKGKSYSSDLSENDIKVLKDNHIPFQIEIEDMAAYYVNRNKKPTNQSENPNLFVDCSKDPVNYTTPSHFELGSMGGFFTYEEAILKIDSLAILYPNIVSIKKPIGNYTTENGNNIYWLKISDNPNSDESEPQILYDAVHHAREPTSLSQLIFYMYYLCENYSKSPEIKKLVDNIEMYFVPIVNPDGYKYNQLTNPDGGGFWRKNRRNNGNNTFGVDLNRNYGQSWGFNNIGSSSSSTSDTYRGTSAFSEPETQAMRRFCNTHNFIFAMNYHTYSNLLVYPWGYQSKNCIDSLTYHELSKEMSKFNNYHYGIDFETLGYSTNGSSDDWMYGDTISKPKMIAFTPEVGSSDDGFWPKFDRIIPLCNEANFMNITIAEYLLKDAILENQTPRLTNKINGTIKFNILRSKYKVSGPFTITLTPISSNIASVGNTKSYTSLATNTPILDSIAYLLKSTITNNSEVKFNLTIDNGIIKNTEIITIIFGKIQTILNDKCNNLSNWDTGRWSTDFLNSYSPSSSFAESSTILYPPITTSFIYNIQNFDLVDAQRAELTFRAKWLLENYSDYVKFEASTNDGIIWEDLCTNYKQMNNNPNVNGLSFYTGSSDNWVYEIVNLDQYIGQNLMIKWTFESDQDVELTGINIDDITVTKLVKLGVSNEDISNDEVHIYPNPSSNLLNINILEAEKSNPVRVDILNLLGQIVHKSIITKQHTTLDIAELNAGIYFIELNFGTKKTVHKIVIEK